MSVKHRSIKFKVLSTNFSDPGIFSDPIPTWTRTWIQSQKLHKEEINNIFSFFKGWHELEKYVNSKTEYSTQHIFYLHYFSF